MDDLEHIKDDKEETKIIFKNFATETHHAPVTPGSEGAHSPWGCPLSGQGGISPALGASGRGFQARRALYVTLPRPQASLFHTL